MRLYAVHTKTSDLPAFVVFDPGDTTGFAVLDFDGDLLAYGVAVDFFGEPDAKQLKLFLGQYTLQAVVIEKFRGRGGGSQKTQRRIEWLTWIAGQRNLTVVLQDPAQRMAFQADAHDKLPRDLGEVHRLRIHVVEAIAHGLAYLYRLYEKDAELVKARIAAQRGVMSVLRKAS